MLEYSTKGVVNVKKALIIILLILISFSFSAKASSNWGDALFYSNSNVNGHNVLRLGSLNFDGWGAGMTAIYNQDLGRGDVYDYNIPHDSYYIIEDQKINPKVGLDIYYSKELSQNFYITPGIGLTFQDEWDIARSTATGWDYVHSKSTNFDLTFSLLSHYYFNSFGIGIGYNNQTGKEISVSIKF